MLRASVTGWMDGSAMQLNLLSSSLWLMESCFLQWNIKAKRDNQ